MRKDQKVRADSFHKAEMNVAKKSGEKALEDDESWVNIVVKN